MVYYCNSGCRASDQIPYWGGTVYTIQLRQQYVPAIACVIYTILHPFIWMLYSHKSLNLEQTCNNLWMACKIWACALNELGFIIYDPYCIIDNLKWWGRGIGNAGCIGIFPESICVPLTNLLCKLITWLKFLDVPTWFRNAAKICTPLASARLEFSTSYTVHHDHQDTSYATIPTMICNKPPNYNIRGKECQREMCL